MNKFTLGALAIACLAAGTVASADVMTFTDTVSTDVGGSDPGDVSFAEYSVDYDSNLWTSINSATLRIFLRDSSADDETAQLIVGNPWTIIISDSDTDSWDNIGESQVFGDINVFDAMAVQSGTQSIDGLVAALDGDFHFDRAELEVDYSPVPVPAAVWLFGSAIAGLGFSRRRNTNA